MTVFDAPSHHTANVLAIAVPAASFWAHAPEILSIGLTFMGIAWYGVLFYDRFFGKGKDRKHD